METAHLDDLDDVNTGWDHAIMVAVMMMMMIQTLNLQFPPYYSPVSTTEFALQTWGYFGYRAIVLPKQHIVHCNIYQNNQDLSLPSGSDILPIY